MIVATYPKIFKTEILFFLHGGGRGRRRWLVGTADGVVGIQVDGRVPKELRRKLSVQPLPQPFILRSRPLLP